MWMIATSLITLPSPPVCKLQIRSASSQQSHISPLRSHDDEIDTKFVRTALIRRLLQVHGSIPCKSQHQGKCYWPGKYHDRSFVSSGQWQASHEQVLPRSIWSHCSAVLYVLHVAACLTLAHVICTTSLTHGRYANSHMWKWIHLSHPSTPDHQQQQLRLVAKLPLLSCRVLSRTPLGRVGDPYEIGQIAAFLASDAASYITGQTIYADGGRMALNYTVPINEHWWLDITNTVANSSC